MLLRLDWYEKIGPEVFSPRSLTIEFVEGAWESELRDATDRSNLKAKGDRGYVIFLLNEHRKSSNLCSIRDCTYNRKSHIQAIPFYLLFRCHFVAAHLITHECMQPFERYVGSDRSVNKVTLLAIVSYPQENQTNRAISLVWGRGGGVFVTAMVEREVCQHFAVG